MTEHDKKRRLVRLLDRKAFEPVLKTSPDNYDTEDKKRKLADIQRSTESERQRYHNEYKTARGEGPLPRRSALVDRQEEERRAQETGLADPGGRARGVRPRVRGNRGVKATAAPTGPLRANRQPGGGSARVAEVVHVQR